ncbi:MAG: tetratricopeptide repeat protein [Myxococcota bacterium]|nr:tetratricopeptide repeat protein [Myxococcota bacterium]
MNRLNLGLALCLVSFGFSGQVAFAQDVGNRAIPKAVKKNKTKRRGAAADRGPKIRSEAFFRKRTRTLVNDKWRQLFKQLKKIIASTPDSDPAKPELYYRLSELFRERAAAISIRAFEAEDACLEKAELEAQQIECENKKAATVKSSQKYRDKAIELYMYIAQNFPQYPRLDNVLYALAFNYQQKGQPDKAKKIYSVLITKFPRSERVPDTLVNFGEILFQDGQADKAARIYKKVIASHKDSAVYGYARYKLGWCHFNMGLYTEALTDFLEVVKYSDKQRGGGRNKLVLKREAIRDIVKTYVHIDKATPKKALTFFRKIAPDQYLDLCEKLARLYADKGKFKRSNQMYGELIKVKKSSYRVVSYQRAIIENAESLGKQVDSVRELKRLVSLWKRAQKANDAEPKRVAQDKKGIEALLRRLATQYHRQASKTKSDEDYNIAYELYVDYMKTFAGGRDSYDMGYYFAELLMTLQKWGEAAENYEKILAQKPDGEHSKDAASSVVVAYKKLLNITRSKTAASTIKGGDGNSGENLSPKPISKPKQKFIDANKRYLKYVRGQSIETDISYDIALIYFDANQFDKAIPRFKEIAENKPKHELAVYAANYLLDSYVLQKDYTALNQAAKSLSSRFAPDAHPELVSRMTDIKQNATFNKCLEIEGKGKRIAAAECFLRYAQEFPESKYLAKAFLNAAVNYEKERQIEKSIRALMLIVNKASDSEEMPKALFQIAKNLTNLAIYGSASKAYEFYAKKFPGDDKALIALQNAAFYRMGLGEYDKAIENYQTYMKLVGKKDKAKAAEVYFSIGKIYEQRKQWAKVVSHYKKFLKNNAKDSTPDLEIDAFTRIGNAYWEQSKPFLRRKRKDWKNFDMLNRAAQRAYNSAYQVFSALSLDEKKKLTSGIASVSEARFRNGESIYINIKYRTKLRPRMYRKVDKFIAAMVEEIKKRGTLIESARKIYGEVIKLQSPNWAIAATARQGEMLEALSNAIYEYPAPPSFTEDQQEAFKGTLTDRAEAYRTQAIEAYMLCMKTAQELQWFNSYSDNAEKRLSILDPGKYRYNAEVRATPTNFGPPTIAPPVIRSLQEYAK